MEKEKIIKDFLGLLFSKNDNPFGNTMADVYSLAMALGIEDIAGLSEHEGWQITCRSMEAAIERQKKAGLR